jgi:hypothetical protein
MGKEVNLGPSDYEFGKILFDVPGI